MASEPDYLVRRYYEQLSYAESVASESFAAAVRIQALWRGYRDRLWLQHIHSAATNIQRVWRGCVGRRLYLGAVRRRATARAKARFDAAATCIQKVARGWISRRYHQDVYARRRYLRDVSSRGDALLTAADAALSAQVEAEAQQQEQAASEKFEHMAEHMHHLLGTRSIPSVFSSALSPALDATAYGIAVEQHIKEAFVNRQARLRHMRAMIARPRKGTAIATTTTTTSWNSTATSIATATQRQQQYAHTAALPQQNTAAFASPTTSAPRRPLQQQQQSRFPPITRPSAPLPLSPSLADGRSIDAAHFVASRVKQEDEEEKHSSMHMHVPGHVSTTPSASKSASPWPSNDTSSADEEMSAIANSRQQRAVRDAQRLFQQSPPLSTNKFSVSLTSSRSPSQQYDRTDYQQQQSALQPRPPSKQRSSAV